MKCKCGLEMKDCGFPNYNQRWECKCGLVKISASSIKFSNNWFMPEWVDEKEFYRGDLNLK